MSVPALGAAWLKVGTQGLGFHIPMSPACPPAMGLWHFCSHSSVPVPIHPRAVPGCSLVLPSTELLGGHGDNAVLLPPVPRPRCSSGFSGEAPPCSGVRDPAQGFPGAFWSCFIDCAKAETEAERRGRRAGGDVWPGGGGMVFVPLGAAPLRPLVLHNWTGFFCCCCNENPTKLQRFPKAK